VSIVIRLLTLGVIAVGLIGALSSCKGTNADMNSVQVRIVSGWVVEVVGSAEETWQMQLGPLRGAAEQFQDEVARMSPLEAYAADWSIGRYNIRPSTAGAALDWAFAQGIAEDFGYHHRPSDEELVRQIMDDAQAGTLVKLILTQLRADHPGLGALDWETIEATDQYVAKLYSGYLGAGGAWEAWRSNLIPGDEAKLRLGCTEDGMRCAVVEQHRPGPIR
jgi:hypothetical protein